MKARLIGGFRYGPVRAAVRSGESSAAPANWALYAAAGKIREAADRDPSPTNLHALGLAHLVLSQYDEAVRPLEDAVRRIPLPAVSQRSVGRVPRTGEAARSGRTVKADESLLEARFNRASRSRHCSWKIRRVWLGSTISTRREHGMGSRSQEAP
jgi:hypothetical protein